MIAKSSSLHSGQLARRLAFQSNAVIQDGAMGQMGGDSIALPAARHL